MVGNGTVGLGKLSVYGLTAAEDVEHEIRHWGITGCV